MAELDFFKSELDKQIALFDKESTKHKKLYRNIKYYIFAFTALSTFLAGIAMANEDIQIYLNAGVVFFTAAIGVANSVEGLRKPSELWILERRLYHSLLGLKRSLEFEHSKPGSQVDVNEYFETMQELLDAAGEKWTRQIKKKVSSKDSEASNKG